MTTKRNITAKAAIIFLLAGFSFISNSSAQVSTVTFSRPATGDMNVEIIEFGFDQTADVFVQIDQLGAVDALFQNNDGFGQDFGIEASGPVDSIGEVAIGDILNPGTDFGDTSLNLSDLISPGENFFLGFSSGADVGYFNIAWDSATNGSIIYSEGQFATGGVSLTVAAVPEPTAIGLLSLVGPFALIRRRRDQI